MSKAGSLVPLDKILQLQRRWLKLNPTEMYTEIGIRSFGKGIFHKSPVLGASLGNKRVLQIQPGDIVFSNVFAWEGAVAVAGEAEAGKIGSHRFVTYTTIGDQCNIEYLRLFFCSQPGLEVLRKVSPGSAGRNRTLNIAQFAKQDIPLPPLEEQLRIVARVEELTGKIEEARSLKQQALEETMILIHSFARRVFEDYLESHITIEKLVGRANLKNGKSIRATEQPSEIKCMRLSAVRYGQIDCTDAKPVPMNKAEAEQYLAKPGDVFIVRGNGSKDLVGQAGVVTKFVEGTIFPDLFIRVPLNQNQILPSFFVAWWNNPLMRDKIKEVAKTTSGIWKINQGHIASLSIPVPPLPEQRRLVGYLDNLQAKVDEMKRLREQVITELDALLPSILDKAFKGEL